MGQGATASIYALLACTAVIDPYRRFVWLFGLELNSLGCAARGLQAWCGARNNSYHCRGYSIAGAMATAER